MELCKGIKSRLMARIRQAGFDVDASEGTFIGLQDFAARRSSAPMRFDKTRGAPLGAMAREVEFGKA